MNIGLAVTRNARRSPDSVAVFDDRGELDYAELDARGNQFAHLATARFGLRRGERVAVLIPNRREVVELMVGSAKAGLVYVGLNFRLDMNELKAVLSNARPRLMVTDSAFHDAIRPLAEEFDFPVISVDDTGSQGYAELLRASSTEAVPTRYAGSHHDDFCLVYSSGTTGVPKGILFDHAAALQHGTIAALEYGIDADSRYLIQIPHNSSVNITMVPCLIVGAAIGFTESRGFDPVAFADRIRRERVTHTFLVPTMLFRLLEKVENGADLASLKTLGYGSSSIPPDRVRELVERFGPIFIQLYGMAEIASIGTLLRKDDHVRALEKAPELLASAGRPSYGVEVRVVDPRGDDVPTGQRGEVVFGGPHLMKGYYRDPERTAEALVDGWMHSGDVGVFDEDGYLFIVDRIKDLIIRGGFNIAPREVEEVLYRHPAVLEAAVVGVPDPEWGEEPRGVVALRNGRTATSEELIQWCRSAGLASIKIPSHIEIVGELPKNQVGKIAKNELRKRYAPGGEET